jgi:hypothetical protein
MTPIETEPMRNLSVRKQVLRPRRATLMAWLLSAMLAPVGAVEAAPKTDVVYFTNGDRLTGEIKGLEKGKLELSTSTAGTVNIEWDKVARIETGQYLEVETAGGVRYHGRVPEAQQEGSIRLADTGPAGEQPVAIAEVVRIAPIDQGSLVKRLDGYVTAGFSYAKADNETEFNFSGGVSTRNEVREWSLDGMTTINTQSDERSTSMYDVTLENKRYMRDRWFVQFFGSVQGNQELALDIREVLGAGMGRYLVQDSHSEWSAVAGLAYDRENFRGEPVQNSLEAVLYTGYSFFVYDTPKRSIDASLALFPSLTESGRIRAEADLDWRIELVEDFFFDLTFYGSYDSKADPSAPSNSDYGVITSLGYTF